MPLSGFSRIVIKRPWKGGRRLNLKPGRKHEKTYLCYNKLFHQLNMLSFKRFGRLLCFHLAEDVLAAQPWGIDKFAEFIFTDINYTQLFNTE